VTNIRFYEGPLENAPVPRQAADCVLLSNVLPYVQDWKVSLRCAVDYLQNDGSLLIGWVDFGIIAYTLIESLAGCNRARLLDLYRMTIDRALCSRVDKPALWIPKRKVCGVVRDICDCSASSDDATRLTLMAPSKPTLPSRFAGIPFYHELVLRKQAIQ
jgi:hypothetical protein